MILSEAEKAYFGNCVELISQNGIISVYKMHDETGEGFMTCYNVFEGIYVIYNDFHMDSCFSVVPPLDDIVEINHCREGRIECGFDNGTYSYMESGDLCISTKRNRISYSSFPVRHYHGISIAIHLSEIKDDFNCIIEGLQIDLPKIRNGFFENNQFYIMRAEKSIEHIFSELYTIPEEIKVSYFKIKILELLLFLSQIDINEKIENREYFTRSQVNKIKDIMKLLSHDLTKHLTIKELSALYKIPTTPLKQCFKAVYGKPIYAFLRDLRMQAASYMLKNTSSNVIDIACRVGYLNSSKFAAAFKDVMGMTPLEFRKSNV